MDYERLVVESLPVVDDIVRFVSRRYRLSADQAEDLAATVRLKLVENDYAVLRQFEGRSSMRTYLSTVIQRHFLDGRTAAWGKWRPSAIARRLGPDAMELDKLINRDGWSFDQAAATLVGRPGWTMSRNDLRHLMEKLPRRTNRRIELDEALADTVAATNPELELIRDIETPAEAGRIDEALQAALQQLGDHDRLLLRMRFSGGLTVTRMARLLDVPQRQLYGRLEVIFGRLRRELEKRGVNRDLIAGMVGHPASDLPNVIDRQGTGSPAQRPSRL